MARKNISKIDKDLQEALKKVELLKAERKESEDNFHKEIGRLFVQKEILVNENISYEEVISRLKNEIKNQKSAASKQDQLENQSTQNQEGA